jgi:Delta7-sterol 5-desaturase
MNLPDFSSLFWITTMTVLFFIVICGRYFLVAGIFYAVFYIWFPEKWKHRKINQKNYAPGQLKKEMKWSVIAALIFSFVGTLTLIAWQKGFTKIYRQIHEYGWIYLPFSLILYMLCQETYYYWIHRWMHIPRIYKIVHKVHHDSKIASPFTAFSFHPVEAALQAVFLPLLLMILPLHLYILIILLTWMTFTSVINHLDIEIYPSRAGKSWAKWLIGATHHSMHHKQFNCNFGLYFTFWDKIRNTENNRFESLFASITRSGKEATRPNVK